MEFFKPLARFHLPLASLEETTLRSVSIYLLKQFFKYPGKTNWDTNLEGLSDIYREVERVNLGLADRLAGSKLFDELNAVSELNVFAQILPFSIENQIADLKYLFPSGDE